MASSIVFLSVAADDGQPWQLPCIRSRTTPSATPSSSTSPPCDRRLGPHRVEGLFDARVQVVGMEPVEQEQAADEVVARERVEQRSPRLAGAGHELEQPREARPVEVEDGLDDLPGVGPRGVVGRLLELLRSASRSARSAVGIAVSLGGSCYAPDAWVLRCVSEDPLAVALSLMPVGEATEERRRWA